MRTIAIGDVHGCYRALQSLMKAIRPTLSDQLIFLGDYVDRGPDSRQVIDLLLEIEEQCRTVFLLGNHEIMFRDVLAGAPGGAWLGVGGRETVASYGGSLVDVPQRHRSFFQRLQAYHETDQHFFVHANYLPQFSLDQQPEEVLFWLHLSDFMPTEHYSGKHAVCGHTPQADGKVGRFGHLTCLDTGCFAGNWLTALDLTSGVQWQADLDGKLNQSAGF